MILLLLADAHPGSSHDMSLRTEVQLVTGEQDDSVWESHMAYLSERGYVEKHVRELRGYDLISWSATADGVNLVDGLVEADPGVALS